MIFSKIVFQFILILSIFSYLYSITMNRIDSNSSNTYSKKDSIISINRGVPVVESRVHRAGLLRLNVSNSGFLGNPNSVSFVDPCTNQNASSGEMPAGSDVEFLFTAALWFGGYLDSAMTSVTSDSITAIEFQGPLVSTGYEAWVPNMKELWPVNVSPEFGLLSNSVIKESSNIKGRQNCLFEDVYDPSATAEEQFDVMFTDKYVSYLPPATVVDPVSGRNHIPLGVEVKRTSYAWSYEYAQKFVIIDYTLYNRSTDDNGTPRNIYNFFMAEYFDCDIRDLNKNGGDGYGDDIGGFFEVWEDYIDAATQETKPQVLNLAWAADNDSRSYLGSGMGMIVEPPSGLLGKETGIVTVRVLRNPNPNLEFSFNNFINPSNTNGDWGPRWDDYLHSNDIGNGAIFWDYDLTPKQKGYDDGNQGYGIFDGTGGLTEGTATTDIGRYMVISNSEFDYDQTKINDINYDNEDPEISGNLTGDAVSYVEPFRLNPNHDQHEKWKKWSTEEDGSVDMLNNLQNGRDTKMILSFGPLGEEANVKVAVDTDHDGIVDNFIDKSVHIFEYGDSLKLTLAFIVNENFHTDISQNPNDGIIEEKFQQGWYDALYNVVWAERVYDIPLYDTPVDFAGLLKGDGWYGEDVGKDGLFAEENGELCWWLNSTYTGRDDDRTEQNNELDTLDSGLNDIYGSPMISEDDFLKYGNTSIITEEIGLTENFGYLIRNNNNEWVRYGYNNRVVDQGDGVPDFTGPPPPPSPKIEIIYNDENITAEWYSHEFYIVGNDTVIIGPEHTKDDFSKVIDFEGYQVFISPDRQARNFVEIFAVDRINYSYENAEYAGTFLDKPFISPDTLNTIYVNSSLWNLTEFGDNKTMHENYETDSFSFVSDSIGVIINEGVRETLWRYNFTLFDRLYARVSYLAVTASDFGDPESGTKPLRSNPIINATSITPTKISNSNEVIVVPNPYRTDIDYSETWEQTNGNWFEDNRKIAFLNIPKKSVIKIYTLAGDLVKILGHNNEARASEKFAENGESWNLINENEQTITSGIYLFSVKDLEDDSYNFVGKFVVIK